MQYWSRPATELLQSLGVDSSGLSPGTARERLARYGRNSLGKGSGNVALKQFAAQFRSPLVLILIFAAVVSASVGETHEAIIIGAIVLGSCLLGFSQEYGASRAMEALRGRISRRAAVLRSGVMVTIAADEIVPGDIMQLSAGNLIAADGIVLEAEDFNVSEAILTGESFPAIKSPGVSPADAGMSKRSNMVFTGTSVRSGTASVLAVKTGNDTEFANIAGAIEGNLPETEFSRGIRQFGVLMTQVMLAIVIVVFFINLVLHRPLVDSLLFSLAIAVGITPELLPAIISVTLARGARALAEKGVIVRRLEAIENLGGMDLLCTDKTGTLTEGVIHLDGCFAPDGDVSADVLKWAVLNATLQTGLKNPLDEAIAARAGEAADLSGFSKIDELPYDFTRKRLSVLVRSSVSPNEGLLICKGAMQNILDVCDSVTIAGQTHGLDPEARRAIEDRFRAWSEEGYRVLGLALRHLEGPKHFGREDETGLTFAGFLLFLDPPKAGIKEILAAMTQRGIAMKVISGDNRYVTRHLATAVGLKAERIVTGEQIAKLTKDALFGLAHKTDLFVEIDPNQKERIIEALRRRGHTVGYMGDGINDAPALHAADIGISVDNAVDVAREAADIILLKQDLGVLLRGIDDGRRTFTNTMKYISTTTSANFGNMISMAFASLFLPFLPLLAKQILLNNFLSDLPSMAIATDNVEPEDITKPKHWDLTYIRRFMLVFGLVSSFFDFATFGFLIYVVKASAETFQTAWFIESLVTELGIVMVVRTSKAFWRSRPSSLLLVLTLLVVLFAAVIPYLPYADWFGFVPLPWWVMTGLFLITLMYLAASEIAKHQFLAWERRRPKRSRTLNRHMA